MNNLCTDIGHMSLTKYGEELCGDMVEVIEQGDDDYVVVLADGLGSGRKHCLYVRYVRWHTARLQ